MAIREVPLPPSAPALARALGGEPDLAVLTSRGPQSRSSFVLAFAASSSAALVPEVSSSDAGWAGLPAAPRWVGGIPYDAVRAEHGDLGGDARAKVAFDRPFWRRYPAAIRIDHDTGRVVVEGDDDDAIDRLVAGVNRGLARAAPTAVRSGVAVDVVGASSEEDHRARIERALEAIGRGEIYQVNLARHFALRVRGDHLALFFQMLERSPVRYAFFARNAGHTVLAHSPELALELRDGVLRTAPIKGTRARGACAKTDANEVADLAASAKERAELVMATDLHRNDLGKVAVPGSVRVVDPGSIESGAVHSRGAVVVARLRSGVSVTEVARAFLPAGSVTGAPKRRAMQVIRELEPQRRGLYTGAIGYVGRDGALVLAMAIRTLTVGPDGEGSYFAGGGIVWGSDPALETEETSWKTRHLFASPTPETRGSASKLGPPEGPAIAGETPWSH